jgi:hypothetical protein
MLLIMWVDKLTQVFEMTINATIMHPIDAMKGALAVPT